MEKKKEKFQGINKREVKRITRSFLIQFKQVKSPFVSNKWDTSAVKNISKTGICFNASRHYELGVELEIKIANPMLRQENKCWATVIRCHPAGKRKDFYEVAVNINKIEEPRETFDKTIEFFIKKENKNKK